MLLMWVTMMTCVAGDDNDVGLHRFVIIRDDGSGHQHASWAPCVHVEHRLAMHGDTI